MKNKNAFKIVVELNEEEFIELYSFVTGININHDQDDDASGNPIVTMAQKIWLCCNKQSNEYVSGYIANIVSAVMNSFEGNKEELRQVQEGFDNLIKSAKGNFLKK